jgi:AcrR family transcriptional regulator
VGVDGLARQAGATSGAFYANFESKDEAFALAVEAGMAEVLEGVRKFKAEHAEDWFDHLLAWYLGESHRKDMACGCALVTLSPEVTRAGPRVRQSYARLFGAIVDEIADGLRSGSLMERRDRARAVLALLAGAVTLSRAVGRDEQAELIAQAARRMAGTGA